MSKEALDEMWGTFVGNAFGMKDIDTITVIATGSDGHYRDYYCGDFLKIMGVLSLAKDKLLLKALQTRPLKKEQADGEQ